MNLNDRSILITGGTGSFGRKMTEIILKKFSPRRLIIFSRDELKQYEMRQKFPDTSKSPLRYFIGDVRDQNRLKRAFEDVDIVIHAAALKQVPASEYNPMECIKTNILGAENIINAALDSNVEKVIALSTDKAVSPVNLYGATKLCSDKLFIAANNMKGKRKIIFSVVRYGNVMGSRGSVLPYFLEKKETGILPITDKNMTRFHITREEGVNLVLFALKDALGGEVYIPKLPSFRIVDLANAVAQSCRIKIIGVRPGEKIHEELITISDSPNTFEFKKYFIIAPSDSKWKIDARLKNNQGKRVSKDFRYSSDSNSDWLTTAELNRLVTAYLQNKL